MPTPATSPLDRIRAAAVLAAETYALGPGVAEPGTEQTGIMVAIDPPADLAATLARPDGSPAEALHVTLVTFPFDTPDAPDGAADAIAGAVNAAVADEGEGFTVTFTHGATFGPEGTTYALEGSNPEAAELRAAIADALTAAGLPWSDDYAFRCHLTLGDYPDGIPSDLVVGALPEPITWEVTELAIHYGPDVTPVPLGAVETETEGEPDDGTTPADGEAMPMPEAAADGATVTLAAEDDDAEPDGETHGGPIPVHQTVTPAALADAPVDPAPGQDLAPPVGAPDPEPVPVMATTAPAVWTSPCLVPFGVVSGDGRRVRGPLRSRPMPLPYAGTWVVAAGHDGATFAGNILSVENSPGAMGGTGDFDLGCPAGVESFRLASTQRCNTVSVDLSDVTVELVWPEGVDPNSDPFGDLAIMDVVDAELIGVTHVMHPAFGQASIAVVASGGQRSPMFGRHRLNYSTALTAAGGEPTNAAPSGLTVYDAQGAVVAAGVPVPGRRLTFKLDRLSFAAGAVPILPGFRENHGGVITAAGAPTLAGETLHVPGEVLSTLDGALAPVMLTNATTSGASSMASVTFNPPSWAQSGPVSGGLTIVAAGGREPDRFDDEYLAAPPARWFAPLPDARGPVRQMSRAGEFGGLIARWTDCHVGYADRCTPPPRSRTGYRAFATGPLLCADGSEVNVGPMFADTVHPDLRLSASDAFAHYHDTGCLVLQVAAGENEHGIWVHGAAMPGLSPRQRRVLQAGRWSGDWRPMRESGGRPELLSVLAVNGPGFPTPAEDANPDAMVAAAGRPGAWALFDEGEALVAGVGLGLVAAGDPCETAELVHATLPDTVDAPTSAALTALFATLAAQVETLGMRLSEYDELLAPARAVAAQARRAELLARLANATPRRG